MPVLRDESPASIPSATTALFRARRAAPIASDCGGPCPGQYVSVDVPFEVVRQLAERAASPLRPDLRAALDAGMVESGGWAVVPPAEWPTSDRGLALEYEKLRAEVEARLDYFAVLIGLYRPWTAAEICSPCAEWRENGFNWAGVPAIRSAAHERASGYPWVLTCGQLQDARVVSNEDECAIQDGLAVEAWIAFKTERLRREAKGARGMMITTIVIAVVSVVVTFATAGAAGPVAAASMAAFMSLTAAGMQGQDLTDPEFWAQSGLTLLANLASAGIGGAVVEIARGVIEVSRLAVEAVEHADAMRKADRVLDAKAASVEASLEELSRLARARATLDELAAQTVDLDRRIAELQASRAGTDAPFWLMAAAAALGLVALAGR